MAFIVHRREGKKLRSYDGNLNGQKIGEGDNSDIDTPRANVLPQSEYDRSAAGKASPQVSKYSFYFYKML